MIAVVWNSGHESGFKDQVYAQRFIDRVCQVAAPGLEFIINNEGNDV